MCKVMYSKIIGLFFCLAFTGCIFETKVPENLIQKEEMSLVLMDLLLKESIAYNLEMSKDSQKIMFNAHYKPLVFKKYQTSSAIFDSSIQFYMRHPKLLDPVAEKTEIMLNEKLNNFKSNK